MENLAVGKRVIHQQHAQAIEGGGVGGRRGGRGLRLFFQRHGEGKDGAIALPAQHAEPAVHQLDELLGNGQAQAGAAVFARRRAIGLREFLEDAGQRLGRDADAGVLHLKQHGDLLRGFAQLAGAHQHLAALGELHRVGREVDEHLPEPERIAAQARRNLRVDAAGQLDAFLVRPFGEQFHRALDRVAQVEVDGLERELARLHLREVQNVVDDVEQRLGAVADRLDVFALLLRKPGVREQAGHAGDGIHRRADFMAHVREELRLGLGGFQRRLAGLLPLLLGLLARGHVLHDAFVIAEVALRIGHGAGALRNPDA